MGADESKDWETHDFALQPITKELLDSLSPKDRFYCKKGYDAWRARARLQDRKEAQKVYSIKYYANPEVKKRRRAYLKEYYKIYAKRPEVKERNRAYNKAYYLRKKNEQEAKDESSKK